MGTQVENIGPSVYNIGCYNAEKCNSNFLSEKQSAL